MMMAFNLHTVGELSEVPHFVQIGFWGGISDQGAGLIVACRPFVSKKND
jgi:hypothetical protein